LSPSIRGKNAARPLSGCAAGLQHHRHPVRQPLRAIWSRWFGRGWLALNGLVLLLGWGVIWLGMVNLINA
jgi:hypothetical protein